LKAVLALEDGSAFEGNAVGAEGESFGELVFNTSMTGYQEILTDPSYAGQIVTMTYPLIGNYGCNDEDVESRKPFVEGFIMRECCLEPSNWRAKMTLPEYLRKHHIVAIDGVDTRKITTRLRTKGAMRSVISTVDLDHDSLVQKALDSPPMSGSDWVKAVTISEPYEWNPDFNGKFRVVAMDYGIKYNILRILAASGCRVIVMPATTSLDEVLGRKPDGVFLSNGPGDPAALPYLYPTIRGLFGLPKCVSPKMFPRGCQNGFRQIGHLLRRGSEMLDLTCFIFRSRWMHEYLKLAAKLLNTGPQTIPLD
jgi:carbamoyl-phosphate synthase small subunit